MLRKAVIKNNGKLTTFTQYTVSNGVNTKIYGIFPLPEDRVLRHIIYPSITHTYSPRSNTKDLYGGYISGLGANYLNMSLSNSLDLRLPEAKTDSKANEKNQPSLYNSGKPSGTSSSGSDSNSGLENFNDSGRNQGDTGVVTSQRSTYYGGTRLDLVDLSSSISYNFWPYVSDKLHPLAISIEDQPLPQLTTRNWSLINHSLQINPTFANWYNLTSQLILSQDPYKKFKMTQLSVVTTLGYNSSSTQSANNAENNQNNTNGSDQTSSSPAQNAAGMNRYNPSLENTSLQRLRAGEGMGEGFTFQLEHEYSPGLTSASDIHTLRGEIGFNLSTMWRIRYDNYYDLHNGRIISEHYRIYRDLHCWEAEVRVSTERSQVEYWFQIRIKELPEFQLFGTREREF
jgi:hypothetical protein